MVIWGLQYLICLSVVISDVRITMSEFHIGDMVVIRIDKPHLLSPAFAKLNNKICCLTNGPNQDQKGRLYWSALVSGIQLDNLNNGPELREVIARVYDDWLVPITQDEIITAQDELFREQQKILDIKREIERKLSRVYNLEFD